MDGLLLKNNKIENDGKINMELEKKEKMNLKKKKLRINRRDKRLK